MCFSSDHTLECRSAKLRRVNPQEVEDIRCSLLGNAFHPGVVALLLSYRARDLKLINKLPSPQQVREAAGLQRAPTAEPGQQLELVRRLLARQTHRGGEVRLLDGPAPGATGAMQSLDATMWQWTIVLSARWKIRDEHINLLESRAYQLAVRWRARSSRMLQARFLHLLDSMVTLGVHAKGRSSASSLAAVSRSTAALLIAGHFWPVLAFVRTDLNPADKPSRFSSEKRRPPTAEGAPRP